MITFDFTGKKYLVTGASDGVLTCSVYRIIDGSLEMVDMNTAKLRSAVRALTFVDNVCFYASSFHNRH